MSDDSGRAESGGDAGGVEENGAAHSFGDESGALEFPLSSPDPAVVEKSLEGMRTSLANAKLWGADTVLLVPAVVKADVSYAEAWERSQRQIRKLIPIAQESKVVIGIEEVWNKFLLSPLEFANYIDSFESPYVKRVFRRGQCGDQRVSAGLDSRAG